MVVWPYKVFKYDSNKCYSLCPSVGQDRYHSRAMRKSLTADACTCRCQNGYGAGAKHTSTCHVLNPGRYLFPDWLDKRAPNVMVGLAEPLLCTE